MIREGDYGRSDISKALLIYSPVFQVWNYFSCGPFVTLPIPGLFLYALGFVTFGLDSY